MAREQLSEPRFNWNGFADRPQLAAALTDHVAALLTNAIAQRGTALLAVSGGTTPAKFFAALSAIPIAWDRVVVTLVDERFVPPSSPRSNAGLVAANLLQNKAAAARFVPLYHEAASIEDAAATDSEALRSLPWPLDVVILGMGGDGHTASFFPDAGNLEELLDPASQRIVLPVHAASGGEPRLTLSMARIVAAGFVALHIEGEDKRTAFNGAMGPGVKKPIRRVIEAAPKPIEVFWAP
ncbi:6-phosphogluconolactonase [Mesorhizobium sp. M2D.F.Ca.ET.185.01.1.1]|uniref:6-phosphogluconolactonase n=1 Tax=unclassified Mesorhizobium TaxID=325217 RepID=UPI000FCA21D2|nr:MULTISPECIES: 6-phosphogluconolactonase [unclassified Mesorhizobium]TGP74436.1 6-phosphogluconolactonase [bacterium M00.F.Ca.ET.227.01.1.1]TGP85122.1 6-phosphogluconolactonase [bacterium M00.F.Ca.ET.221.01.1.1]TGP89205.1 6-phosphogluconolactonase [bacterium M00.F.Ca.ET.222.01.1.1]TGU12722.1 6-phosphogluconolactonase [bacterium M00.F.Ca.ET.163.01.1.1]TGU21360.1 6-phosphogluconolactonase [bacterium M00.F.Ca.ET.156.01.1.1]TGU43771.1 6-phosphogluconolactonase [bacterium M00.F.Ca.ET.146.01.1.1]